MSHFSPPGEDKVCATDQDSCSCYWRVDDLKSFSDALMNCSAEGGQLLLPTNSDIQNLVVNNLTLSEQWVYIDTPISVLNYICLIAWLNKTIHNWQELYDIVIHSQCQAPGQMTWLQSNFNEC
jgi:hypothetical protein